MMTKLKTVPVLVVCASAVLLPGRVSAQGCVFLLHGTQSHVRSECSQHTESRTAGHAQALAINAGIGGLTAGLAQKVSGGSFIEGFLGGALGGGIAYGGKWLATSDFDGSALLGRQVSAVGASVVGNASQGNSLHHRFVFPVGPLRVAYQRHSDRALRARLDLANLVGVIHTAAQPSTTMDWNASLLSGTPVFSHESADGWIGRYRVGVVSVRSAFEDPRLRRHEMRGILRHEMVHVLQNDFTSIAWARPGEQWILHQLPAGPMLHRYFEFRLDAAVWLVGTFTVPYHERPWEREAVFLTER